MNKFIEIHCPKDQDKRYFSKKDYGYSNSLNIYLNNKILFAGINDCEEMLPIKLLSEQNINLEIKNELRFDYNIEFENSGEEKVSITFIFENNKCSTVIERKNYVDQSENLDGDYTITFEINDHVTTFGKEYHEGNTKRIEFETSVDLHQPVNLRWWSKKTLIAVNPPLTYDDMRVTIWN